MEGYLLLFVVVGAAVVIMSGYNRLQSISQRVSESLANIQNAVSQRHGLVEQLFKVVQEYGVHESQIHTAVAQLESQPGGLANAGIESLTNVMTPINRAYPDLKQSANVQHLLAELERIEDRILQRRDQYNAVVRVYNTEINSLPTLLYAKPLGFTDARFYDHENPESLALFQPASGEKMREAIVGVSKAIAEKSTQVGGALIDESRQISVKAASTVMSRGRDVTDYGRKKLGRSKDPDEAEMAEERREAKQPD